MVTQKNKYTERNPSGVTCVASRPIIELARVAGSTKECLDNPESILGEVLSGKPTWFSFSGCKQDPHADCQLIYPERQPAQTRHFLPQRRVNGQPLDEKQASVNPFYPYRYQDLFLAEGKPILLVSRPEDVEYARFRGLIATCPASHGLSEQIFLVEQLKQARIKHVLMIAPPGDHDEFIVNCCQKYGIYCDLIPSELIWENMPPGGNLYNMSTHPEVAAMSNDEFYTRLIEAYRVVLEKSWQKDVFTSQKDVFTSMDDIVGMAPTNGYSGNNYNTLELLDQLIESNISGSELKDKLAQLAGELRRPVIEVEKLYHQRLDEQEKAESRGNTANTLELLLQANQSTIPLDLVLPKQLAEPLTKLAGWLNVRPECYLLSLLVGISSLHHPMTKIILNAQLDFTVGPNLYGAIVAPPSQKKSPILRAVVTKPMRYLQNKAKRDYLEKMFEYQAEFSRYEQLRGSKKQEAQELLQQEFPEGPPQEPRQKIYYFNNATTEGIVNQFNAYPEQGLLQLNDELAAIFKSLNQYRGGKGSDQEFYLSAYDGEGFSSLRAGTIPTDLDQTLLAVLGAIQPGVLKTLLGDLEDSNGNWARFFFVNQPLTTDYMDGDGGSIHLDSLLTWLYEEISNLPAQDYRLTSEAFETFRQAYNHFGQLKTAIDTHPAMRHFWGKAAGAIGKLAINLHRIESVFLRQNPSEYVEQHTIQQAIALVNFFASQVQSLYTTLDDNAGLATHLLKVLQVAERKQDWITARDVTFSLSSAQKNRFKASEIRDWFKELENIGKGITQGNGSRLKFKITSEGEKKPLDKTVTDCYQAGNNSGNNLESLASKDFSQSVTTVTTVTDFSEIPNPTKNQQLDQNMEKKIDLETGNSGNTSLVCAAPSSFESVTSAGNNSGNKLETGNSLENDSDILVDSSDLKIEESLDDVVDNNSDNSSGHDTDVSDPTNQNYDFNELLADIDSRMKKIGMTPEIGKKYLQKVYGVCSRHQLCDTDLIDFWKYMQTRDDLSDIMRCIS